MIYESTAFQSDYWENIPDEIIQRGINDYYIQLYLEKHGKKMAHLNNPNIFHQLSILLFQQKYFDIYYFPDNENINQ